MRIHSHITEHMGKHEEDGDEFPVITLTLEDDTILECALLSVFEVENEQYAALLPVDDLETEEGEIFLYHYKDLGNGELDISNIEDDDEFDAVSEAFDAILDNEEFNGMNFDFSE